MQRFEPVVEVKTLIEAPAEKVWETVTHDTGVMFMGAKVDTDWVEGHPITFAGEWKGKKYEDHGEIQRVDREKRVSFTHFSGMSGKEDRPENYNLVTLELTP